MDQSVRSNETLNDSWIQHEFEQHDLNTCRDWQFTTKSRK